VGFFGRARRQVVRLRLMATARRKPAALQGRKLYSNSPLVTVTITSPTVSLGSCTSRSVLNASQVSRVPSSGVACLVYPAQSTSLTGAEAPGALSARRPWTSFSIESSRVPQPAIVTVTVTAARNVLRRVQRMRGD